MAKTGTQIVNKRASFEYHILQKYTAGMQLTGSEIKSIRAGNVNLNDAFCFFKPAGKDKTEELVIRNMHIGSFKQASYNDHEPLRIRKLLLKKSELVKLRVKAAEKGLTIIPLRIFFSETGYAKLEIAVGQGKKSFDKRESIKEKDLQREAKRNAD
jgi:SsrA-binding protein